MIRCLACAALPAAITQATSTSAKLADVASAPSAEDDDTLVIDSGAAGVSAQQEFSRRHARREQQVRAAHPRIGGLILALSDDPQSTRSWQSGAVGERKLAARLAKVGDTVIALHDRSVPGTLGNLDHVVVGPAGVYVIDAKRYRNGKVSVRRSGGLLRPVREQLIVSGRDKTKLVTAMDWQVTAVRTALASSDEFGGVTITAALCFIDAEFPLFGALQIGGVHVKGPGGIAKFVARDGPLDAAGRMRLARHLAAQLPVKGV